MPPSPHHASRRIIALLAAMTALNTMSVDLYTPAFPTLRAEFGLTENAVQATLAIFFLGAGLGQFVVGPLLDSFGRRRLVILGTLAFALGSLACALATGYEAFLAGRFLQALGAAVSMVAPRTILTDVYEGKDVARIYSIIVQIMMVAPVIAPFIGAFLLTHLGWRADFYLLVILGGVLLLAVLRFLPETLPPEHRRPWHIGQALASYGAVLTNRRFTPLLLSSGFVYGALFCYIGASPFAFISGYHITPMHYSLIVAGISFASIVVGWANIRLLAHYSVRSLLNTGFAIQLALLLLLIALIHHQMPGIGLYTLMTGAAMAMTGLVFSNVIALAMINAGPNAGIASAALAITQSLISASTMVVLGITGIDRLGMVLGMMAFTALAMAAGLFARHSAGAVPTSAAPHG